MKWKKIEKPETSRTYKEEKQALIDGMTPEIYPCKKCGHPVVEGYACTTCHDTNPSVETPK